MYSKKKKNSWEKLSNQTKALGFEKKKDKTGSMYLTF